MRKLTLQLICVLSIVLLSTAVNAEGFKFNMLKATPIGSWQVSEQTVTDHKGRMTVSNMRSSMLGSEERNGKTYYWIEMVIQAYKVKKEKRKPQGDETVMKVLIPASAFTGDAANIMGNLRAFGEEIIMQSGDEDPMRMSGAGGFMDSIMKGMNIEVKYDFTEQGSETIETPAGSFNTKKVAGSGSTTAKIVFKTLDVQSTTTAWLSGSMPFATVKSEGTTTTNGKKSTHSSEVLEFGTSGATSLITKEPQDMPEMPSMKGLFGG